MWHMYHVVSWCINASSLLATPVQRFPRTEPGECWRVFAGIMAWTNGSCWLLNEGIPFPQCAWSITPEKDMREVVLVTQSAPPLVDDGLPWFPSFPWFPSSNYLTVTALGDQSRNPVLRWHVPGILVSRKLSWEEEPRLPGLRPRKPNWILVCFSRTDSSFVCRSSQSNHILSWPVCTNSYKLTFYLETNSWDGNTF